MYVLILVMYYFHACADSMQEIPRVFLSSNTTYGFTHVKALVPHFIAAPCCQSDNGRPIDITFGKIELLKKAWCLLFILYIKMIWHFSSVRYS